MSCYLWASLSCGYNNIDHEHRRVGAKQKARFKSDLLFDAHILLYPSPNTIKKFSKGFFYHVVIKPVFSMDNYTYDVHIKVFSVFPMLLFIYDLLIKMFKQSPIQEPPYSGSIKPGSNFDSKRLRGLPKKPSSLLRFVCGPNTQGSLVVDKLYLYSTLHCLTTHSIM